MEKIKILIVEDHPLMRQALEFAILTQDDMDVVHQASNGLEALNYLKENKADVVLLDLMMPKMDGFETISHLMAEDPDRKILVVTSVNEREKVMQTLTMGVSGYVTKDVQRDELIHAIRTIYAGEAYLESSVTEKVVRTVHLGGKKKKNIEARVGELSKRQREIFELLGQGLSNEEIADELEISPSTVRVHLMHIINKLGFRDRHETVVEAVKYHFEKDR